MGSIVGVELDWTMDDWIAMPFPPEVAKTVELLFWAGFVLLPPDVQTEFEEVMIMGTTGTLIVV